MRRWGWGQWRCPSEGHGRECGLRPSVQSGVPRCGALSPFLYLSLSLPLSVSPPPPSYSLAHTLPSFSCPLRYHATLCSSSSVCASSLSLFSLRSLSPSLSVSLPLSGPAARCGAARQTARMHQMHRTDRCPSLFYRFHLFTSAVLLCLSPFFLPLAALLLSRSSSLSLSLVHSVPLLRGSSLLFFLRSTTPPPRVTLTSFTSFCRRRRTATLGNSPLLYQRVMLLPHVLAVGSYLCTSEHTVRRRSTLSLSNIGSYIATRAFSLCSFAPSRYFFFPSFFLPLPS